jgi:hypothetical protein
MASVGCQVRDQLLNHVQQRQQFFLHVPFKVVGAEHPEGDDFNAKLVTPADEFAQLIGARAVAHLERAAGGVGPAPAPIAVRHDGNMPGQQGRIQFVAQSRLVGGVQKPGWA